MMKKDIETRTNIELLVSIFYERVRNDDLLNFIFRDVAHVDWAAHLPRMTQFWENLILHSGSYDGNPMTLHLQLHNQTPLTGIHFERWNEIFIETITALFAGDNVERAISRTLGISAILKERLMEHPRGKDL